MSTKVLTLSIHKTKEGAQKAIDEHKAAEKKEFDEIYEGQEEPPNYKFDEHKDWCLGETELLD